MDDKRKDRRGPPRSRPADGSSGRKDGAKPFRKRQDGDRPPRSAGADGEKRTFRPRTENVPRGEGRPERSFKPRDGGDAKPFRKRPDGDRPPRSAGADGEKRTYRSRTESAPRDEGRPERSFKPRDGDGPKPFRKRPDGDRPPRAAGADGEKRTYRPQTDNASKGEGRPERSFKPRDGDGAKPFRKRPDGDRPRSSPRSSAPEDAPSEKGERIAKRLARAGISSRRDAEAMIEAGRVRVNGRILSSPAINVQPEDVIQVDNEQIPAIERTRLFLFHKPVGVVTTNRDPEGRRTVFDVLPEGLPRLVTVGRLDINTEGLLLLTNDGGLARVLELPNTGWLRRYRVRVHGKVDEKALGGLRDGIAVDGVFYGSIEATLDREQGTNAWLTIGLREGKNREVKNVLGALGLEVSRLIRISYGPFQLGELPEGSIQELKGRTLRDQLGDRLIEEAGADFEAEILTTFSNRPVARERFDDDAPRTRGKASLEVGEGGLVKGRRRSRDDGRERALGQLQTTAPREKRAGGRGADGPRKGKGKRDEKPYEPPRSRSSNVWMAPGARPQGTPAVQADAADKPRSRRERTGGPPRDGNRRPPRKRD